MSEHSGVIRFANVEQTFGRADGGAVTALDGITFDIGRNEFLAVLFFIMFSTSFFKIPQAFAGGLRSWSR